MAKLNPTKTAYAVGLFAGIISLIWTALVAIIGQSFISWWLSVHLLSAPISVAKVTFGSGLAVVITHLIVGAVFGWIFATAWNKVNK